MGVFPSSTYIELMQYTGLKDSKGKEIFEWDILHGGELNYVVTWICSEYHTGFYKVSGNSVTDIGSEITKRLEIIGNIYESPELLKVDVRAIL
jgi:uncharacterized phage protein (TIGR01671 family)